MLSLEIGAKPPPSVTGLERPGEGGGRNFVVLDHGCNVLSSPALWTRRPMYVSVGITEGRWSLNIGLEYNRISQSRGVFLSEWCDWIGENGDQEKVMADHHFQGL